MPARKASPQHILDFLGPGWEDIHHRQSLISDLIKGSKYSDLGGDTSDSDFEESESDTYNEDNDNVIVEKDIANEDKILTHQELLPIINKRDEDEWEANDIEHCQLGVMAVAAITTLTIPNNYECKISKICKEKRDKSLNLYNYIALKWISSHCEINGNRLDLLAKCGTQMMQPDTYSFQLHQMRTFQPVHREGLREEMELLSKDVNKSF
ncbi:hypothetical protein TNCV_4597321 [Trichonephila clavipes]|nr:hypothetical protein TNCV_4597321 [Trichonephila clavipes]